MPHWYLEAYIGATKNLRCIHIDRFPFLVGRSPDVPLRIDSPDVSRHHAEFVRQDNTLALRDLGSTNGTFVNTRPIAGTQLLRHGDIIHFANMEYRLMKADDTVTDCGEKTRLGIVTELPRRLPGGLLELRELLRKEMVQCVWQPIVRNPDAAVFAHELLGRGAHPGLPAAPGALFRIAESAGLEVELSELFRTRGLLAAAARGDSQPLFVNTHPREMRDPERLLASLLQIRAPYPELTIVLEVHEEVVVDLQSMLRLKESLAALGIGLAYDDFGHGQGRLLELTEVPPDYLKFDISLIAGLDQSTTSRRQLLESLLGLCRQCGIMTLAEGVQSEEEVAVCRDLGFDLLQGFYFAAAGAVA